MRRFTLLVALALTASRVSAAGRPLAPRTLAPTIAAVFTPQSAYAGGRFLTVWLESRVLLGSQLMGVFSDANGAKISEHSFPLDTGPVRDYYSFHLLADGESFILIWRDAEETTHIADVGLDGRLANRRTVMLPDSILATFAANGTYITGVLVSSETRVVMFDRDGTIVLPPERVGSDTYSYGFDVAAAEDGFVAFTINGDGLAAYSVTPAGAGEQVFLDFARASVWAKYHPNHVVSAPAADGGVLAVWGASSAGPQQLKSSIVRADGTPTVETLVATGTEELVPVDLLSTGDGYVVLFTSGYDLRRIRLDPAGVPRGESEFVVSGFGAPVDSAAGPGVFLLAVHPLVSTLAVPIAGAAREPQFLSVGFSRQLQPILGAGGGGTFAAWPEFVVNRMTVRGTAVDAAGNPGAPVSFEGLPLASTQTAWNGVHHLVLQTVGGLLVTRVTAGGTVVDQIPITLDGLIGHTPVEAAVVWNGTRWVVVWTDSNRLHTLSISAEGKVFNQRLLGYGVQPTHGVRYLLHPALAFDGQRLLLAWWQFDVCQQGCELVPPVAYATRLTRNGFLLDSQPIEIDSGQVTQLSAASSGTEFLVMSGPKVRVLDEVQSRLQVTASRDAFDWPAESSVTWDGINYVAALRYSAANWYLGVLRLDRSGNDVTRLATATLAAEELAAPGIAAPFPGNALIGVQEGSLGEGFSAVLYRERDLAPMPAPPGPPRNVRLRQVNAVTFEAAWKPPAGGNSDSYVVEVQYFGEWQDNGRVPGTARHLRLQYFLGDTPAVRVRAFNAGGPSAPANATTDPPKRRVVR